MLPPVAVSKTRRKEGGGGGRSLLALLLIACYAVHSVECSSEEGETGSLEETLANTTFPMSADDLGIPRCETNHDCVANGVCQKGKDGHGRCLCPGSCPSHIPLRCRTYDRYRKVENACLMMDENYTNRFNLHHPVCHAGSCACPPMFDPSALPTRFNTEQKMLPIRCDRREMNVKILASVSPSVFRGAELTLFCCTNMDPSRIVEFSAVQFIQNTTIVRETTSTPFDDMHKRNSLERLYPQWCWVLRITNAQFADSGTYSCNLKMGRGEEVEDKIQVVVKAPRSIQDFNVTTNTTFAELTWTRTDVEPPLVIDLRLVRRTDRNGQEVWTMKNASSSVVIQDLRPATPYTIFVSVVDGQSEPYKFSQNFQTKDARPHAPKPEDVRVQSEESGQFCEVEWRSPPVSNGRITKYYVRVEGSLRTIAPSLDEIPDGNGGAPLHFPPPKEDKCANYDTTENADKGVNPVEYPYDFFTCKYGPLKPNRNYSVSLWAENKAARSMRVNFTKSCMTDYAEPGQVDIPQTRDALNNTHFTLRFDKPPKETNGPISCYYIAVVPLPGNVSIDSIPTSRDIIMDTMSNAYTNNLHGNAIESKRFLAYIAESYSDLPYETIIGDGQLSEGSSNCSLNYLGRFRDEDGPLRTGLKYTGFIVVRVDKIGRTDEPELFVRPSSSSNRSRRQTSSSAASEAVYGYSDYFKPVFLRTTDDSSSLGTLIAICVSFLLLAVAAVGASVAAHRFGLLSPCLKKGDGSPLSTGAIMMGIVQSGDRRSLLKPAYEPIPAENLPQEFIMKHRDSDYLFTQEFEALPYPKLPATASCRNASKNRYKDIVAFDETRVKLNKVNGVETSDYINANWIKSYGGRKRFIASQAPLESTLTDFWRMIWEHDIRIVVMLSNLVERNRNQSAKYWPDELSTPQPAYVGDFSIIPCGQQYMADHCIRTFDVTYQGPPMDRANGGGGVNTRASPEATGSITSEYANVPSSRGSIGAVISDGRASSLIDINHAETRRIVQYHYTAWNDYKAPECPTGLLRFLMKLRSLTEFEEHPSIIHCSAGVGRTGTLIAIDSLIDQCQKEGKVDVFGFVGCMRRQRNLMVQNTEQYVFIYRALAEHQMFGETDRSVEEFNRHWREISRKKEMEREFERLKNTLEVPPTHKFADKNPEKNRYPSAVPYDNKRVILAPVIGGHADAQYINASTVKGHFYPYILAQDPLGPDTAFDFWRMIIDHNVATIVMLTPEEEFESDEKYWPSKSSSSKFSTISVSNLKEDQWLKCRERTLSYHNNSDKPRTVVQYCVGGWDVGRARPSDTESMISVIGRVLERQSQLADDMAPILLHSRNGSTECGVLCAISLLIERLKAEERVDVFQTVHGIKHTRPHTFATIEEYEFVYETIHSVIRRQAADR
ncbi:hypothetical protein PENTCL1PPCAC_5698 [Pristionchus entomophagus]|uniref:protein-tyrosine-phosphatase n=1 Tax=Pristionchus entomophagus TaxID=358040 RepID=A0AAV5SKC0_9BILA|nr:hypothetical protein PENTCL1PPCAC_5698 [Pristionchus entomophagus]